MRVNVYAEEMTDRVEIISKEIDGHAFTGLRIYLELPVTDARGAQHQGPFIHRAGDDDSAAVTFWGKRDLRGVLRKALALLDRHYAERHPIAETRLCAIDSVLGEVREEAIRAMSQHRPMISPHDGYAVIQEEVDELWDEIKGNRGRESSARDEALQVAAMGVRYVVDLHHNQGEPKP